MSAARVVHDQVGRPGILESEVGGRFRVRLPRGVVLDLPSNLISRGHHGSLSADIMFESVDPGPRDTLKEVEETLQVSSRTLETGRVIARTVLETTDEPVDANGWRETVDVERVQLDRVVDSVDGVRIEDGVTIIPVYEEVLVVQKQLVLREELHLTTRREVVPGPSSVPLRHQHVEVERHPPSDTGAAG